MADPPDRVSNFLHAESTSYAVACAFIGEYILINKHLFLKSTAANLRRHGSFTQAEFNFLNGVEDQKIKLEKLLQDIRTSYCCDLFIISDNLDLRDHRQMLLDANPRLGKLPKAWWPDEGAPKEGWREIARKILGRKSYLVRRLSAADGVPQDVQHGGSSRSSDSDSGQSTPRMDALRDEGAREPSHELAFLDTNFPLSIPTLKRAMRSFIQRRRTQDTSSSDMALEQGPPPSRHSRESRRPRLLNSDPLQKMKWTNGKKRKR